MEPPFKQGGNPAITGSANKNNAMLQWSRLSNKAETRLTRPRGRLIRSGLQWSRLSNKAETNEKLSWTDWKAPLQWSRLSNKAETAAASVLIRLAHRFNGAAFQTRRKLVLRPGNPTMKTGFNGAAFQTRRKPHQRAFKLCDIRHCFNGAAFQTRRKHRRRFQYISARLLLQWSRLSNKAETRKRKYLLWGCA